MPAMSATERPRLLLLLMWNKIALEESDEGAKGTCVKSEAYDKMANDTVRNFLSACGLIDAVIATTEKKDHDMYGWIC